jgi:ornithine cyclodeaminase
MKIITLDEIKRILPKIDVISAMEEAFVYYSSGQAVVPPVGELLLDKGDVHIKYGYIKNEEFYVIKIASGFYDNSLLGLSSSNGMMLLFKQETGEIASIQLDEGHLTDIRTAAAGAVAAKYLAPKAVERIGIIGTGIQARLQLEFLKDVVGCKEVLIWGRGETQLASYQNAVSHLGFDSETTLDAEEILKTCNLIVTTTPSEEPLLFAKDLRPGTHITAVGSDTSTKQELDSQILFDADLVVADSVSQCLLRGEIHRAIKAVNFPKERVSELGEVISGSKDGRTNDSQITIADLTGVAVQDIKIAEAVHRAFRKKT